MKTRRPGTEELAEICKALSSQTRLDIVQLLRDQPLCVGALAARLDVTPGAVSQHLRILRSAGLVLSEKRGYYVHYRLNEEALGEWQEAVAGLLEMKAAGKTSRVCDDNDEEGS